MLSKRRRSAFFITPLPRFFSEFQICKTEKLLVLFFTLYYNACCRCGCCQCECPNCHVCCIACLSCFLSIVYLCCSLIVRLGCIRRIVVLVVVNLCIILLIVTLVAVVFLSVICLLFYKSIEGFCDGFICFVNLSLRCIFVIQNGCVLIVNCLQGFQ